MKGLRNQIFRSFSRSNDRHFFSESTQKTAQVTESDYDIEKGGFRPLRRWMNEYPTTSNLDCCPNAQSRQMIGNTRCLQKDEVTPNVIVSDSVYSEFRGNYILGDWLNYCDHRK